METTFDLLFQLWKNVETTCWNVRSDMTAFTKNYFPHRQQRDFDKTHKKSIFFKLTQTHLTADL